MKSCLDGAPDERGRCPAAEPVALMRPLVVVVAHELGQRAVQRRAVGEVSTPEGHAPVLFKIVPRRPPAKPFVPARRGLLPARAKADRRPGPIEGPLDLATP